MGGLRPPNPPASLGRPNVPPDASPGRQGPTDPPCAQARIARTAGEHEAIMVRNMMSNHTCSDRPLPTCKTSIVVVATIFTSSIQHPHRGCCGQGDPFLSSRLGWWSLGYSSRFSATTHWRKGRQTLLIQHYKVLLSIG